MLYVPSLCCVCVVLYSCVVFFLLFVPFRMVLPLLCGWQCETVETVGLRPDSTDRHHSHTHTHSTHSHTTAHRLHHPSSPCPCIVPRWLHRVMIHSPYWRVPVPSQFHSQQRRSPHHQRLPHPGHTQQTERHTHKHNRIQVTLIPPHPPPPFATRIRMTSSSIVIARAVSPLVSSVRSILHCMSVRMHRHCRLGQQRHRPRAKPCHRHRHHRHHHRHPHRLIPAPR